MRSRGSGGSLTLLVAEGPDAHGASTAFSCGASACSRIGLRRTFGHSAPGGWILLRHGSGVGVRVIR
jgi:hypothetical protein